MQEERLHGVPRFICQVPFNKFRLYPQILQASVCLAADRNILEELCLCGKVEEVVAILKIMPDTCVLDQYDIVKLLINAINNTVTSTIGNLVNSIGHQKGVSTA